MPARDRIVFWGWVLQYAEDGSAMEFVKRSVVTDGRTVLEMATVKPGAYDFAGVALPTFEDAHTHLADRKLEVKPGTPAAEVVRPPDGLKHRYLKAAPESELVESIRAGVDALVRGGATRSHEFREGGIGGVRAYRKALEGLAPERRGYFDPVLLGRPGTLAARPLDEKGFWEKMRRLLERCDGLGLSAVSDGDPAWNAEVARFARSQGKALELHCSETEREPVEEVLELGPQLLVHMAQATAADLKLVADARVPVAVCARSNEFFGLRAPVELMAEAGVDIRIGTDNAFLGAPSMLEEARTFARVHKARAGLTPMQILSYMLRRKGINGGLSIAPREGTRPDFLIVTIQTEKPERDLIARAKDEDVAAIVGFQGASSS